MTLKLFNSLTNKKETFNPLNPNQILIYVCGITPYDTTHLGHAFTYTQFDVLIRYLSFLGYQVNYTQNVTDIDDDLLKKAKEESRDWKDLGDYWTGRFLEDMKTLNVLPPNNYIKATDSISEIIEIIASLLKKGLAYENSGNVYFEVKKFPDYGKLSKLKKGEMLKISAERGANINDSLKKDPLDFILWQKSLDDEPFWDSPFSRGRPGWHIECSAMIYKTLGPQIDIHGGGMDLIYPHHESEIAQSESFTNLTPFSRFWSHIAMLEHHAEKMSKSLGNLIMVSDLLKKYSPNAIRWLLLSHHYRETWEFKESELIKAQKNIVKIIKKFNSSSNLNQFKISMDNDLNTPQVLKNLIKNPSKQIFELLGFSLN